MKTLNTREYVKLLQDIVEEGREASMTIIGSSMAPFLCHERDRICFSKPDRELKKGDIVFYKRDSGQYVCHRILRVRPDGLDMIGDAQTEIEKGIRPEQIFARITRVERKGKVLTEGDFWWEFFRGPWLRMIKIRPFVVKLYSKMTGKR